jgi:ribosomal protein S18 acetylase RimI-like enzyme
MHQYHKRLITIGSIAILFGMLGTLTYYYQSYLIPVSVQSTGLSDYDPTRDRTDIIKLFETDRYLLTNTPGYSPEHMLDTRSPNKYNPAWFGKLRLRVLREDGKFIGFTGFYPRNFYLAWLLFVAVDPAMRGKKYGEVLVNDALDQMRKLGYKEVGLDVRVSNERAQKLYKRLGFTEFSNEGDGFIQFSKTL